MLVIVIVGSIDILYLYVGLITFFYDLNLIQDRSMKQDTYLLDTIECHLVTIFP